MIGCVLCAFRERAYRLQWKTDPTLRWTKATVQEFCMQKPITHQGKSFLKQLWFPFKSKIDNRWSRIILQKTQSIKILSDLSALALRLELSAAFSEFLKQTFVIFTFCGSFSLLLSVHVQIYFISYALLLLTWQHLTHEEHQVEVNDTAQLPLLFYTP